MGRKIPAKKHRGVKDPLKQQELRLKSLKAKINAPPKDPDEQPVPRSLTRLFAFQDKHTNAKREKEKKVKELHSAGKNVKNVFNPVSKLKRLPGESGRSFSLRINDAVRSLNDPAEYQMYPQQIDEEDVKGQRMREQRERREKKRRRAARAQPSVEQQPKLSRAQKFTLRKKAKKSKVTEGEMLPEVVYERVGFGEVAHAPPALRARAVGDELEAPRPGRRDLLLSKLLMGDKEEPVVSGARARTSTAERLRRERARLDAVAAYRMLKADRMKHKLDSTR